MSYEDRPFNPQEPLNQGDILRAIYIVPQSPGIASETVATVPANVVILSADCELDKFVKKSGNGSATVAIVSRLDNLDKGLQGQVRKNVVYNYFYLPKEDPLLPLECYIDWRTQTQVNINALVLARASQYVCTLSTDLMAAVGERFWDYHFRPRVYDRNTRQAPFNPDIS